METNSNALSLEQVCQDYEWRGERKQAMARYEELLNEHDLRRKQEAAAEAERTQKHSKRNRLSQWWYNRRIARRDERWWQEEQELLELANPLQAMMRYKEHYGE